MAKTKHTGTTEEVLIAKAKDFWDRYSKPIMVICVVLVLLIGGYYGYQNFIKRPKEQKASDAIFKAEEYYRLDSVKLALNGDGQYPGFLSVISKYDGTDAANLASFYAGSCYLKLGDDANAVKYLKKFSTDAKQIQARAYKLLGDAYADLGKNSDALENYKKAANEFTEDQVNSAEALFMAAYFADKVMKDSKQAISLYKELKEKYPSTPQGIDADKYLAVLGVYDVE
ncbi:MAG: tetratricopeptide repeat protein [Bacteroidetes bacterium]|nr:tetratricopeptide repeat protein [Bacteroidota bacterium]MBS1931757.1 tetratricopeptide repeat protein [Bacteroidota bacterium]